MTNEDIKKIWNGFGPEGQNMSLTAFTKEIHALISQENIQRDLQTIKLRRARQKINQNRIDRSLN